MRSPPVLFSWFSSGNPKVGIFQIDLEISQKTHPMLAEKTPSSGKSMQDKNLFFIQRQVYATQKFILNPVMPD